MLTLSLPEGKRRPLPDLVRTLVETAFFIVESCIFDPFLKKAVFFGQISKIFKILTSFSKMVHFLTSFFQKHQKIADKIWKKECNWCVFHKKTTFHKISPNFGKFPEKNQFFWKFGSHLGSSTRNCEKTLFFNSSLISFIAFKTHILSTEKD